MSKHVKTRQPDRLHRRHQRAHTFDDRKKKSSKQAARGRSFRED